MPTLRSAAQLAALAALALCPAVTHAVEDAWFTLGCGERTQGTVAFTDALARVWIRGEAFELERAPSGSGARYVAAADPDTVLWNKGRETTLTLRGESLPVCTTRPAEVYRGRGNEPFWSVEVAGSVLSFRTAEGRAITAPVEGGERVAGGRRVTASSDGTAIALTRLDRLCADTMSGTPFPEEIELRVGNKDYRGCGGEPLDLLLGPAWTIEELAGLAVIEGSEPTIRFAPEGRVHGRASCNSYSGSYTLTGEGVTFSGLLATRMACARELMDQEQALFDLLANVLRFERPSKATLALVAADGRTVTARRSWAQLSADPYTRYELLEPSQQSFRIVYDVTGITPHSTFYFNPIRVGSEPTVHSVTDLASGAPLEWRIVSAEAAREEGLDTGGHEGEFIRVELARPVPEGGEGRIRIDKTYRDPASVFLEEGKLVFERPLGVPRNAVVLPPGYELVSCNYPSQVATEADGRVRVSFMNRGPAAVPYRVEARLRPAASGAPAAAPAPVAGIEPRDPVSRMEPASARTGYELSERAAQNREIVYFLLQPETHSFRLYHDYTESRPGVDRYVNVVRPGSRAKDPSAKILDTGEELQVETLRGEEITARGIDLGEPTGPDSEAVVIWFDAVRPGESKRLRIEETYTDAGRYGLDGDELLWDRSFGRPRNAVVLPPGWYLTTSSIPAVVSETASGEIRLDFENDRPGTIDVLMRARRR